jgi:hypothetical protein
MFAQQNTGSIARVFDHLNLIRKINYAKNCHIHLESSINVAFSIGECFALLFGNILRQLLLIPSDQFLQSEVRKFGFVPGVDGT